MFEKLTPEILLKFTGGELDIFNPSTCHLRGEIDRIVASVHEGGFVCAAKIWFRWLAPKRGRRIVAHEDAVKGRKGYSLIFNFTKVLMVRPEEVKVKSSENEVLSFLAPGSEKLDGHMFRESQS